MASRLSTVGAPHLMCGCGMVAARHIVNTSRDPNHTYFKCPNWDAPEYPWPPSCSLWIWEDLLADYVRQSLIRHQAARAREAEAEAAAARAAAARDAFAMIVLIVVLGICIAIRMKA